jgi:hypothetical protein
MLSVMCGVFAMIPITFGISGYVLVSREGAVPKSSVTPQPPHAKYIDTLTDWKDQS